MNSKDPILLKQPDLVLVIISNGPGELTTWVRPIVIKVKKALKTNIFLKNIKIAIRLVLVPCPNSTGNEYQLAQKWQLFDKITPAKSFWNLLINPNKYAYWPSQGIVLFLGGDQFWNVLLSARLRYKSITYAEWIARWPFWNDRIAAMTPKVKSMLDKKYQKRCTVVGDLMADIEDSAKRNKPLPEGKWIALMPGSKKAKLMIGIPFFLELADRLFKINPELKFLLPIAPTTNINEIQKYSSLRNPISRKYKSGIKTIVNKFSNSSLEELITINETRITLLSEHPSHEYLSQCDLALTTVGANTAELGSLGVPMIVIIPTQHLGVMQAWDGIIGILGRLPILKRLLGLLISLWRIKQNKFFAWPNIAANRLIVPERIGNIYPQQIAKEASEWIDSKTYLSKQKEDLRSLRGKPGAIKSLSQEILELMLKCLNLAE